MGTNVGTGDGDVGAWDVGSAVGEEADGLFFVGGEVGVPVNDCAPANPICTATMNAAQYHSGCRIVMLCCGVEF